ncbi:MAG: hypothetical protein QOE46_1530 [Acidobacteriota bacterium]|jgi:hypothetical protein|nr:hypothetical protein [Acidobacteriota bacterium]
MKRWKKIALALFALLLLSQVPFAYRRYRLGRLGAAVDAVNSVRVGAPPEERYEDYAGVFHVHSSLGGHSTGRLEDIVRAAKQTGLAFVLMTEHPSPFVNTAEATLKGTHEGVLFVGGSELAASDGGRLFVLPGVEAVTPNPPLRDLVAHAKTEGRLAVVGYPEQVGDLAVGVYDGMEVYNLYTNAKRINYATLFFDGLWSYWGRTELLFARFYERPDANLKRWDEINASGPQRVYAYAGNDAHANVGISLQEQTGEKIFDIKLDPYERSFRLVRTHVLVEKGTPLDAESLLAALRAGHSYVAFDVFGDASGFRFMAGGDAGVRVMGDEIELTAAGGAVTLSARAPVRCRMVFFRNGQVVREVNDSAQAELSVGERGVYRVEVYLNQLGSIMKGKPWIISNPIFVR